MFRYILAFACVIVGAASAAAVDEEGLASRFSRDIMVDWGWSLDCSYEDRLGRQSCYFKAYPSVPTAPSVIDKKFKETFFKIVAIYSRLLQDKTAFQKAPKFVLELNSSGGEVMVATEVGRQVRALHGEVRIGEKSKCLSACVFILMGGEQRLMRGNVGIHRPSFQVPDSDTDISQVLIKRHLDDLTDRLRSYAKEMNIAPRLIDDMLTIPPERMRLLSKEEMNAYGLVPVDPVVAEMRSLEEAKAWGLTRRDYMVRKQRYIALCNMFDDPDGMCYRDVMSGRR